MGEENVNKEICRMRCEEMDKRLSSIEDRIKAQHEETKEAAQETTKDIKELTVISAKLTQICENSIANGKALESRLELIEQTIMTKPKEASTTACTILSNKVVQYFIVVLGICLLAITLTAVNQGSIKDIIKDLPK